MIIYERTVDTKNADKKPELAFAQAAINSDGRITIRNYHSVDIAINHDPAAIAMHKANHPNTKHYCEDVWKENEK